MSTQENLREAFAGESQANRKYLAFALQADTDGYPQVARLFRAAAAAETVHAIAHLRVMGGIQSTAENLKEAIEGEGHEFQTMYPKFIEEAESENQPRAVESFQNSSQVDQIHHEMYNDALEAVKGQRDMPDQKIFVCQVCGNTVYGQPPEKCP